MKSWENCKNILLIRMDNMGDVLMSNAAFQEIRDHFSASKITLLTSSMAAPIVPFLGTIDEYIVFDSPWMKVSEADQPHSLLHLIEEVRSRQFDACILFNVYSQNIMAPALLAYLAEIPLRAGYARENPYLLLTHWYPDPEPLFEIKHQIQRDLKLLEVTGISPTLERLPTLASVTSISGLNPAAQLSDWISSDYTIVHLEVSEDKRKYPASKAQVLIANLLASDHIIVFTGKEISPYLDACIAGINDHRLIDLRGLTNIEQLLYLIAHAQGVIAVNTSIMHIACAYHRPLLALYANTNPQHSPWGRCQYQFVFDIPEDQKSQNQIIAFVDRTYDPQPSKTTTPDELSVIYEDLLGPQAEGLL